MPSYTSLALMTFVLLCVLGYTGYRAVQRLKKQTEFRRLLAKSRYADPFMDFNIEVRELLKEKKFSSLFVSRLEETFKKFFFRVFDQNVHFDDSAQFVRALKGLGAQPHEVRSFFVLEEEYKKFIEVYKMTRGQVKDRKKDFLFLAKQTVNKIRKYVDKGGD